MVYFGLDAEEYDRSYSDIELLRKIGRYLKDHLKEMIIVVIFVTLASVANGLTPFFTSKLIGELELNRGSALLIEILVFILILNSLGWGFNFINQFFTAKVVNHVVFSIRSDVNKNVMIQDLSFFDKYPTGKIVSRINSDTYNFGEMAKMVMQTASSFLSMFIILIPMLIKNFKLTLIILIMTPFIFAFTLSFRKIARKKTLLGQRSLASVNSFIQESMTGIQIAKTFRQEHKLYKQFNEVNKQCYKVNLLRALYMNLVFPGLNFIQGITLSVLIYFGGNLLQSSTAATTALAFTAGDLYLFIMSLMWLFFPLFNIAAFWPQFQTGMAAAERTFALIDSKPKVRQNTDKNDKINKNSEKSEIVKKTKNYAENLDGLKKLKNIEGKIEFKELCFNYVPEKPIFDHFDLNIAPGESVAIVGHTGAGKSSLARLILRFYEFQSGSIEVDDLDIRDLELESYRKHIGLIPQSPFLWADTLENNVKYGSPDATKDKVIWALEQAGGADWIEDLPNGLDTNIRERGKLLSMGQRQLVVFARVLLQDPSILILDEATASVDPFTETRIQEALQNLMQNRTSIIIAHRLHTVRHVNRIIVLDHGKIVEEGNHKQLMEAGGYYATLYNTYFKHQSYEYVENRIQK